MSCSTATMRKRRPVPEERPPRAPAGAIGRGGRFAIATIMVLCLAAMPTAGAPDGSEPPGGDELAEGQAGPAQQAALQEGREADHEALRALLGKVEAALNQQDAAMLGECLTEEFVLTTADQRVITGRDELEAYYQELFKGPDAPVKRMTATLEAAVLTRFVDEHTGICYGTSAEHYELEGGRSGDLVSHWTATCVKVDGRWLVAAVHAGVDFMDNPVLDHVKRSSMTLTTVVAVVALLLGAVLARFAFRRSGQTAAKETEG